jgi:predicted alpha/beta-hydrolase family hydrolase
MDIQIDMAEPAGRVSAILLRPDDAWLLYVVAHGAGAGMRHPFLESVSAALAGRGIATLRYQFPYMEAGRKRPDSPGMLEACVRAAVLKGRELVPHLPLIAGGKSLGGRMTSGAAASGLLTDVEGLVLLGFPLHAPGKPGTSRADHLGNVDLPLLFLQGSRDDFARLDLITDVCEELGANATLHVVEDADHSFAVPKRSGRTRADIIGELTQTIAEWGRGRVQRAVSA